MEKINCDICLDLLPLVHDGVASAASERAVKDHIGSCDQCRQAETMLTSVGTLTVSDVTATPDRIWKKIKKQVNRVLAVVIGLSILFGVGLTSGVNIFYNILIMPAVGIAAYLLLRGRSYIVIFLVLIVAWLGNMVFYYIDSGFESILVAMLAPLYWSIIYASLVMVGIVIAFLLDFAFRREPKLSDKIELVVEDSVMGEVKDDE